MNDLSRSLDIIATEIKVFEKSMKESVARHAWEIGKRLNEAKAGISHGEFTTWLESNFEFTGRYAQEFMKFNSLNPNLNSVFDSLEWTKIRQIISLPETIDRQDFIEQSHTIPSTGETKTVDEMTNRELREVKKFLQSTEQRANQLEAKYTHAVNQHSEQQEKLLQQIEDLKKSKISDSPETMKRITSLEKQLKDEKFKTTQLRTGYQEVKEKLKVFEFQSPTEFDEEQAENQRKKLKHEADLSTMQIRIAYKKFIEEAAISSYLQGAIASASQGEKAHLQEMVEMAEKVVNDTKSALKGRKLGDLHEH